MIFAKFALDANGMVQATNAAPSGASTLNGAAYMQEGGSTTAYPCITTAAVNAADGFIGGFRYTTAGALRVSDVTAGIPASNSINQGILMTDDGQVCYSSAAGTTTLNGVSLTADGAVSMAVMTFLAEFEDLGSGAVDTTVTFGGVTATFTRATSGWTISSTGTWVEVASGTARSYYSPSGTYLGYLAEGARTNLVVQSQDFNTTWSAVGTPTFSADSTTLGALNLDTIGDNSATVLEGYTQNITFTGNAVKAISIHVKQGTSTSSVIRLRDTTAGADRLLAAITWSAGAPVVTMTTGTDLTGTPVRFGSSRVYRLSFATTSVTAANTNSLEVYPATDAALDVANTGTIEAGGVQAENATFSSTYIPTTTAAVTRNADTLTYPLTGWFNTATGTIYGEFTVANVSASSPEPITINDGTDANRFFLGRSTTSARYFVADSSVSQADITAGTFANGNQIKCAAAYGTNDFSMAAGGTLGTPDASGTLPTVTQLSVGGGATAGGSSGRNFAPIRRVAYYNARLPNATLQLLTD